MYRSSFLLLKWESTTTKVSPNSRYLVKVSHNSRYLRPSSLSLEHLWILTTKEPMSYSSNSHYPLVLQPKPTCAILYWFVYFAVGQLEYRPFIMQRKPAALMENATMNTQR